MRAAKLYNRADGLRMRVVMASDDSPHGFERKLVREEELLALCRDGIWSPMQIKSAAEKLRGLPSYRLRKLVDFGFLSDDGRIAAEWLLRVRAIRKGDVGTMDGGALAPRAGDPAPPVVDAAPPVVLPIDYKTPVARETGSGQFWGSFCVAALAGVLAVKLWGGDGGTWVAVISVAFVGLLLAAGKVRRRSRNPMVPLVAGLLTPLLFWLAFLLGGALRSWM